MKFQIRFDGPPGPQSGRFVEVEDAEGHGIKLGEWVRQGDEWLLVVDTGPSHAYCDNCMAIQPVFLEAMENVSTDGGFLGGDLVCKECAWIVATLYSPAPEEVKG